MIIPDKRIVLVSMLGGLIGIALALLLLYANPQFQILLLAILFIMGGEATFMVWGVSKINHKDNKSLGFLIYIGVFSLLFAVFLLFFRQYLEMYTVKIAALGMALGLGIECFIASKLYLARNKTIPLIFLIITIALFLATIPFMVFSPFLFQTRFQVLAILCLAYSADVFMIALYLLKKIIR